MQLRPFSLRRATNHQRRYRGGSRTPELTPTRRNGFRAVTHASSHPQDRLTTLQCKLWVMCVAPSTCSRKRTTYDIFIPVGCAAHYRYHHFCHWNMAASAQHYATTTPETCTHGATSNNHYVEGPEIHHGRSLWTFKQVRVLPSPGSPHSAHRLQVAYDN